MLATGIKASRQEHVLSRSRGLRLHMALLREGDTAWPAQEAFHHKRHRPGGELPSSLHRATARRVLGAQSRQARETPGVGDRRLLLPTASTRPPRLGGSLLGLLEGSAPGSSRLLLLTVTHSRQALLCPSRLPPVAGWTPGWEGREESRASPAKERSSGWLWACGSRGPSDPFIQPVMGLAFWDCSSP